MNIRQIVTSFNSFNLEDSLYRQGMATLLSTNEKVYPHPFTLFYIDSGPTAQVINRLATSKMFANSKPTNTFGCTHAYKKGKKHELDKIENSCTGKNKGANTMHLLKIPQAILARNI